MRVIHKTNHFRIFWILWQCALDNREISTLMWKDAFTQLRLLLRQHFKEIEISQVIFTACIVFSQIFISIATWKKGLSLAVWGSIPYLKLRFNTCLLVRFTFQRLPIWSLMVSISEFARQYIFAPISWARYETYDASWLW